MTEGNDITRREAIARTALLLGGTLAAAHLAGAESPAWAAAVGPHFRARTLSSPQSELVASIAEHILPATDTPGARAAGVDRFVDVILTDYYKAPERERFVAGLADVDARSQKANGKTFLASTPAQQVALLRAMDAESYPPERVLAKAEPSTRSAPRCAIRSRVRAARRPPSVIQRVHPPMPARMRPHAASWSRDGFSAA